MSSGSSSPASAPCRRRARWRTRTAASRSPPAAARSRPSSSRGSPGAALFVTALGEDEHGRRSLRAPGRARRRRARVRRGAPTRRALTLVDDRGERTITTFGERLEPRAERRAVELARALRRALFHRRRDRRACARRARRATCSWRARVQVMRLGQGVALDALVLSGEDQIELRAASAAQADARRASCAPKGSAAGAIAATVRRAGGGRARCRAQRSDSYGCGDSFAAGLTYALGAGCRARRRARARRAPAAPTCLTGHGPYERQLSERARL